MSYGAASGTQRVHYIGRRLLLVTTELSTFPPQPTIQQQSGIFWSNCGSALCSGHQQQQQWAVTTKRKYLCVVSNHEWSGGDGWWQCRRGNCGNTPWWWNYGSSVVVETRLMRCAAWLRGSSTFHRLPAAAGAMCEYYSAMCKYFAGIQTLQTSLTPHGQWTFPGEAELNFPTKVYFITIYLSIISR